MFSANNVSAAEETGAIENTRTALGKWVQTKDLISKEKRDFELKKEILNQRIELIGHEIDSLHGKINDAESSIAEADKKRQDLLEENNKLKEASVSLQDTLITLEQRTRQLLRRLPDPIRNRVKPLSQRLPENPDETKLSVSERFQNVVGILNEVDKFNREITVISEVRDLPDGSSVEVATVYIGIGQAYYASANGSVAGIGTAADEEWVWKQNNQAAPQIAEAIAILKNEKVASFVLMPVEIQ
jgi:FtsZ-binding cell division protein ZapB